MWGDSEERPKYLEKLQRKLARIAYPKSSRAHVRAVTERSTDTIQRSMMTSNMQSRADATVYAEHRAVTEMMQRIECMRKSMGMRFLGVPMTLQKATTVGFVLYSIIIFITHLPLHMQWAPGPHVGGLGQAVCGGGKGRRS